MRKGSGTKTRISITIDKNLSDQLNFYCAQNTMKVSNYIEKMLKEKMEKEDEDEQ